MAIAVAERFNRQDRRKQAAERAKQQPLKAHVFSLRANLRVIAALGTAAALFTGLLYAAGAKAASAPAMITPGKFDVTASGAATYSIPIVIPPGTAGMVPQLSLQYLSQSGDGILGLGWMMTGLPTISRCPLIRSTATPTASAPAPTTNT